MARGPQSPDDRKLPLLGLKYRIDAILRDNRMTASQKVAVAAVALHGNGRTGLAYPGERYLRREYHVGGQTIREALACPKPGEDREPGLAIGTHLEPAGHGPRGVQQYGVIPSEPPARHSDGPQDPSSGPSAPHRGALNLSDASESSGSAPDQTPSAPGTTAQRACGGRETDVGRGDVNESEERGGGVAALCLLAFGPNGSERQMEQLRACIKEAKQRGATDALLKHRLEADSDDPFETVRAAGKQVRGLLEQFTAMTGIKSPTLADIVQAEFDPGVPDGLARQADLEELRERHTDLLQHATSAEKERPWKRGTLCS